MDIAALIRPHILSMQPYEPVYPYEVVAERLGLSPDSIFKLDANENPYGPPGTVRQALAALRDPHIYPDPGSRQLRAALSESTGVPLDNLIAGAGADELIDLVMRLFIDPGDRILICPPTFGMYAFDGALNAARVVSVPRKPDFSLDLEGLEAALSAERPKLVFLASPNNPDGGLVPRREIERLLDHPTVLVLDEAYIEFAGTACSLIQEVPRRQNLIVLRTFSKWAGLAGLRAGYGAFPRMLANELWKIKQPYNLSRAASAAALAALEARTELETSLRRLQAERERLMAALQETPWLKPYPSQANFILCRVLDGSAARIHQELARRGILVRYFATPELGDHLRISVGTSKATDRLLAALKEIV